MRQRTTKAIAKRIQLDFWKRPFWYRSWYARAWGAAVLVAALALSAAALRGDHTIYRPGDVSTRHAIFGDDCVKCHAAPYQGVADGACLSCHDGPPHSERATGAAACATCHAEHRGNAVLADAISDGHCTRCHVSLTVSDGQPVRFASGIAHFARGHPEFKAVREKGADASTLVFTHELHLREGLKGPKGPETLGCTSCHAPDASRARMRPVAYEESCARCHPLEFDGTRFPGKAAPHAEPALVRAFLRDAYAGWLQAKPDELLLEQRAASGQTGGGGRVRRTASSVSVTADPASAAAVDAWVQRGVREAEQLLYAPARDASRADLHGSCVQCHAVAPGGADAPPQVLPTAVPAAFMPHARFDHETHRVLACASCHAGAPTSRSARDVLLPSIETCKACHRESGSRSSCATCHVYHDKAKQRDLNGRLRIESLSRH